MRAIITQPIIMVKRIDHTQLIRIINLGRYLMNTKEKKPKTKSKKDLLREIIEIDDRFDTTSLSRTNIANLKLVRDLVLKV